MKSIIVKIPPVASASYTITIGTDILSAVPDKVRLIFPSHRIFVVTDANIVAAGHLKSLISNLKSEVLSHIISPAGESSKNMTTLNAIIEKMEKEMLGRDTVVIALGGGTVGDIAGFAASIFKRGVPVVQIPTTTVAQADSAIGGKTGVDSSLSKNAFGVFWQPAAVFIDVAVLKTLDERQFRAGIVESLKHALIADSAYFDYLEKNLDLILARDLSALENIAYHNCRIKASVVEADPFEKNQRRILNYGHTIGHAIESASDYRLLHGEAVALGIIAAGHIEESIGLTASPRLARIKGIFEKLKVPTSVPPYVNKQQVWNLLRYDKKAVGGRPRFVLLDGIGSVYTENRDFGIQIRPEIVRSAIDNIWQKD